MTTNKLVQRTVTRRHLRAAAELHVMRRDQPVARGLSHELLG
jgi:hypothetical protein